MFCKVPHNTLTIQPDGFLSVCCAAQRTWHFGHISEVDDLQKAWAESQDVNDLRNDVEPLVTDICGYCLKGAKQGLKNSWVHNNVIGSSPKSVASVDTGKITILEFTTSNMCNQTCVTCSSYYSSKWAPLEKEATEMSLDLESWKNPGDPGFNDFGAATYRMSDADIAKILPLLPHLEHIVVKGGEPFADNNNYYILQELLKVNSKCCIDMTTNLSKVPQKYLDLFKGKQNAFRFSVSMDGIGKTYEWVRSTPFEQTLENIERVNATDFRSHINVNHRVNIFNLYNVRDTLDFWQANMKKYNVRGFSQMGWVNEPKYAGPSALFPKEDLDEIIKSFDIPGYMAQKGVNWYLHNLEHVYCSRIYTYMEHLQWRKRMHLFAEFMNYKRGINIYELHPELLKL